MSEKGEIKYKLKRGNRIYKVQWLDGHVADPEDYGLPLDGCIIALHVAYKRLERDLRALKRRVEELEKR